MYLAPSPCMSDVAATAAYATVNEICDRCLAMQTRSGLPAGVTLPAANAPTDADLTAADVLQSDSTMMMSAAAEPDQPDAAAQSADAASADQAAAVPSVAAETAAPEAAETSLPTDASKQEAGASGNTGQKPPEEQAASSSGAATIGSAPLHKARPGVWQKLLSAFHESKAHLSIQARGQKLRGFGSNGYLVCRKPGLWQCLVAAPVNEPAGILIADEQKPNTTPFVKAFHRRMPGIIDLPLEDEDQQQPSDTAAAPPAGRDGGAAAGDNSADPEGDEGSSGSATPAAPTAGPEGMSAASGPGAGPGPARNLQPPAVPVPAIQFPAAEAIEDGTARVPAVAQQSSAALAFAASATATWHLHQVGL